MIWTGDVSLWRENLEFEESSWYMERKSNIREKEWRDSLGVEMQSG